MRNSGQVYCMEREPHYTGTFSICPVPLPAFTPSPGSCRFICGKKTRAKTWTVLQSVCIWVMLMLYSQGMYFRVITTVKCTKCTYQCEAVGRGGLWEMRGI